MPIFKKGDQQDCNNYRPISVLSNFSKLIEKLQYNRFGFRNHHSPNQASISITETIRNALNDGKYLCGVFLDFQKAFDTVNHEILFSQLEHYGIRGMPLKLFQNYLMNRT